MSLRGEREPGGVGESLGKEFKKKTLFFKKRHKEGIVSPCKGAIRKERIVFCPWMLL